MTILEKTVAVVAFTLAAGCGGNMRSISQWETDSQALLATHTEAIKACYNAELKKSPKLSGAVVVSYTVEPDTGAVRRAKIDAGRTTAGEPLRKCVLDNLLELKLSPANANIGNGTNTWVFNAADGAATAEEVAPPTS